MNFYLRWLEEMAKLRGLGKGLDALLSAANVSVSTTSNPSLALNHGINALSVIEEIALNNIKPGQYQPRQIFDETQLQELADSINQNGVIQPVILRKISDGYELIAGERRWRASRLAGLTKIPAIIRQFNDQEALAISLIENIQRKDLNIIEEANGYRRLIEEFSLTHEQLAKITGRSRSHITNILRLLNLDNKVQNMLLVGQMEMGHARALLPLPSDLQLSLAQEIVDNDLTTSEVERRVAHLLHYKEVSDKFNQANIKVDPDIARLENKMADRLGMMVQIKHGRKGNGKIILNYNSLDELDNLIKLL